MITPFDRDLLESYLDNSLSQAQLAVFEERLKQEPELADELFRVAREETVIQSWAKTVAESESLKNLAPAESLDNETAIAEIERRTERPRKRLISSGRLQKSGWVRHDQESSKFLRWGLAGLAASILIFVSSMLLYQPSQPQQREAKAAPVVPLEAAVLGELTSIERSSKDAAPALVLRADGQREPAEIGVKIRVGDRLETRGASVRFSYTEEATRLDLAAAAKVAFLDSNGAKQIQLDSGTLDAVVAKQPDGRPMRLETPHAATTVVGTRFRLIVTAANTQLDVSEGLVRFQRNADDSAEEVAAGQSVRSAGPATLVAKAATNGPGTGITLELWKGLPGRGVRV